MGCTLIQVGQCGNQLGPSIFNEIISWQLAQPGGCSGYDDEGRKALVSSSLTGLAEGCSKKPMWSPFLERKEDEVDGLSEGAKDERGLMHEGEHGMVKLRAVLVDLEPRVIDACLSKRLVGGLAYDSTYSVRLDAGGSGNNWAAGYFTNGPLVREQVMEAMRRQAETADWLDSIVVLHSAGGGTGSGLGTYLTEQLVDEFPDATKVNGLVWPNAAGDVAVQAYNSVFTVAHLEQCASAAVWLHNDIARAKLRTLRPEMDQLNEVLAQDICASFLLPVEEFPSLSHFVRAAVPNPSRKCLQANAQLLPQSARPNFLPTLNGLLKRGGSIDHCIVTLRGKSARSFRLDRSNLSLVHHEQPYNGTSFSAAILKNTIHEHTLQNNINTAMMMNINRAYTHHYTQHGMEEEHIENCLINAQQVVNNYQ